MVERRGGLGLEQQPLLGVAILDQRQGQDFECHRAFEPCVLGFVNLAHTAGAEQ